MLIDTMKILRNQGIDTYLLLPGPEDDSGACKQYAKKQGMADYCRFLGWRSDIGPLMYASDMCTASSIREGFGLSLVEAMYCGLPVVATDNRGHRTIIRNGENGYLVNVNDSKTMAERILQVLKDSNLYGKLSHQDTEQYDCRKVAQILQSKIEKIVSGE